MSPPRPVGVELIELGQETIYGAGPLDVVSERLADDLLRQLDRGAADVVTQLGDDLLALGLQLVLPGRDDAIGLLLRLALHLLDDLAALLVRVLTDASGLQTGLGELGGVLLVRLLRLGL